jgi:hypothetical protein
MDISELLQLGIEASIALAGFAGVIATYQIGEGRRIGRGTVAAVTVITRCSLLVGLACALVLLLRTFGVDGSTLWGVSSAIGAVMMASVAFSIARSIQGETYRRSSRILYLLLQSVGGFVVLGLILNAAGLVFDREPGPFIAGAVYGLSLAGIMFSRLLLKPLWQMVRELERANSKGTSAA